MESSPNMKECNENLVEDEHHLLIACSAFHQKYDDLLDWHDNASVILKCSPRVSTCVRALFSHKEFLL